ncbi:hypothetical protein SAY86_018935 [Trapa natans]|uniref:5'-3' exonuclease domain-containing protein n=1 Tax=Trapa natans TaxID=22666 RepID=A0AAN7LRX9_TRANT|nr:hypothetical protein SAY86_018935 [Trapa natans]
MVEIAVANYSRVLISPSQILHPLSLHSRRSPKVNKFCISAEKERRRVGALVASASSTQAFNRAGSVQPLPRNELDCSRAGKATAKGRVFFLDVNPLCYEGSRPSLSNFGHWISIFFSQVCHSDPVIAVFDGERGNEHRQQLLPSYKAHRKKYQRRYTSPSRKTALSHFGRSTQVIRDFLQKCNVPVMQVEGHEADDIIATLVDQVLEKGYRAVIASPDKDFKQLISEDVQIVMPVPELGRWSFYTLKHYVAQYNCDPCSDLSLRCILGDEVDGVPGLQHLAPAFGRKTAIKLLKKHGSLESLLNAAAVRTVGKQYAQEALTKHAEHLRRNYEVLALKRDVNVFLQEDLLVERNKCNDPGALTDLFFHLQDMEKISRPNRSYASSGSSSKSLLPHTICFSYVKTFMSLVPHL